MVTVCNSYTATTSENGHRDLLLCEFCEYWDSNAIFVQGNHKSYLEYIHLHIIPRVHFLIVLWSFFLWVWVGKV